MIVLKSIRPAGEYTPRVQTYGESECLEIAVGISTGCTPAGPMARLFGKIHRITYHAYADYVIFLQRRGDRPPAVLKPLPRLVPLGYPCSGRPMLGLYSTHPRYSGAPITPSRLRELFGAEVARFEGRLLVVESIFTPHSLGDFQWGDYEIVYRGRLAVGRLERRTLGVITLFPRHGRCAPGWGVSSPAEAWPLNRGRRVR